MNRLTSRLIHTAIWVAFAVAMLLLPIRPALAQDDPTMEVHAGFDGYAAEAGWIPLQIVLSNDGPDLEVVVRVRHTGAPGGSITSYERTVSLPTHSHKRVWLYVPATLYSRSIPVQLVRPQRAVFEVKAEFDTARQHDYLAGVLSAEPSVFYLLGNLSLPSNGRMRIASLTPGDLPPEGRAWDSLDALVLHDPDWTQWDQERRNALRNWVAVGGHLVITSGPTGLTTAPEGLAELLPTAPGGGTETVDDLPTLAALTGASLTASGPFVVARMTSDGEKVLLWEGDRPLLARQAHGAGLVDVLALDPALAPLRNWPGTEVLWDHILNPAGGSQIVPLVETLSGDPINLYNLPSLGLPSVWQLMLFLLVYVAIIGPVNYLVLRRFKRRELAWFTIPAIALFFSGLAYATGFRLRGGQVVVYETSVIHVRAGADVAAVDSFVGLFSPRRTIYQVSLPGAQLVDVAQGRSSGEPRHIQTIVQGDPTLLPDVRVDVGAVRSFRATTYQPWTPLQTELTVGLPSTPSSAYSLRIQGRIHNASSVAFKDCVLAWQGSVYPLGDLARGQNLSVDESLQSGSQSLPSFAEAIAGGNRYGDPDVRARYMTLDTLSHQDNHGWPPIWDDPYLICWAEEPIVQAQVEGRVVEHRQTTLFFNQLPYRVRSAGDTYIPPEAVTHRVINAQGNYRPAYNGYSFGEGNFTGTLCQR